MLLGNCGTSYSVKEKMEYFPAKVCFKVKAHWLGAAPFFFPFLLIFCGISLLDIVREGKCMLNTAAEEIKAPSSWFNTVFKMLLRLRCE